MKSFLYLLVCCGFALPAQAIVNIESQRKLFSQEGLHGRAKLRLDQRKGAKDIDKTSFSLTLAYLSQTSETLLFASNDYAKSHQVVAEDESFFHLRQVWPRGQTWAGEVFIQQERDLFTLLQRRRLWGAGARYRASEEEATWRQYLGAGAFAEEEIYANEKEARKRGNFYWQTQANFEQTSFSQVLYYQPAAENSSDFRILEEFTWSLKGQNGLGLSLSLRFRHDNAPYGEDPKQDWRVTQGITYSF